MMKNILKKQKGITLITLSITVLVLVILTEVLIYNIQDNLKIESLRNMQNDIANLRDKILTYYEKYNTIPINEKIEYTNIQPLQDSLILSQKADTGKFYVIELKQLENLTLNYGRDYEKITTTSTAEEINKLTDLYIINADSLNIFYVQGIKIDNTTYYTDYDATKVDQESVTLIDTSKFSFGPGKIATKNEEYQNNGKAIIPEGFMIVPGKDDVSKGLVISDNPQDTEIEGQTIVAKGNQFVWIPVNLQNEFKRRPGAQGTLNYYAEPLASQDTNTTIAEYEQLTKSVEYYEGFYIGRYEAGTESNNTVVKKGMIPYFEIPWSSTGSMQESETATQGGAVELSRNFIKDGKTQQGINTTVKSTLCYAIQWDTALNFIDPDYKSYANNTDLGNYSNTNPTRTGQEDKYSQKNIYDMAGNLWEWNMEAYYTGYTYWRVRRGGCYNTTQPPSSRNGVSPGTSADTGFRIALYIQVPET